MVIDQLEFQQRIGSGVLIYEDTSSLIDIQRILQEPGKHNFSPYLYSNMNLGYSESTLWLKIPIINRLDKPQVVSADLQYPLIDEVDFYVVENGEVLGVLKTGDHLAPESKSFRLKNYIHRFALPANSSQDLYLRVKTTSAFSIQLEISTEKKFIESLSMSQAFDAAYFGLAVGLMLYNLFLFFLIREETYLEYTSFVLVYTFFAFCLSGYPQLVFPEVTLLIERGVYIFGVLSGLMLTQFCRSYLQTAVGFPRVDKVIKFYMLGIGFIFLFEIFGPLSVVIKLNSMVILLGSIILFTISIARYRQGFGPAKYFVLSQGVVLLSVIFTTLSSQNVVPGYYMASTFIKLANGFELILFSIGLAERINLMKAREVELSNKAQAAEAENQARKRYINEIDSVNQQLELAVKSRSEFLANMSHEIRTPMNGILGMLDLIDENQLSKADKSYVEIARRSGKTLLDLINDILDLSKIEADKLELESGSLSLRQMLKDLQSLYKQQILEKDLELKLDVDESIPEYLIGDRTRLWQILTNLTSNAIKFTKTGSVTISVSLASIDGKDAMKIAVIDTGIGIPKESQAKIFESFTQADGSTTRQYGGTGLGLTISRKLIAKMGGELKLESMPDVGSTFFFVIPVQEAEAPADIAERITAKGSLEFEDINVLLVEDNVVNQRVAKGMLKKLGVTRVTVAENGAEAFEILNKASFDIVFMDVQMPVMDGYEATRRIRQTEEDKKQASRLIVAMTANAMEGDAELCIEAGMNDYLSKPLQKDLLEEMLIKHLSGWEDQIDQSVQSS